MRREKVLESDIFSIDHWLQNLRVTLSGREISEAEKNRSYQEEVFRRMQEEFGNYPILHHLCKAYEESSSYEWASAMEKIHVKFLHARALMLAYLDNSHSPEVRNQQLAAARNKLREAREAVALADDSDLQRQLEVSESFLLGIDVGNIETRVNFHIPMVLPIPDGEYMVRLDERIVSVSIAYRLPGTVPPAFVVTENAVGFSAGEGTPDGLTVEPASYTMKVELPATRRISLGSTEVVMSCPGALSFDLQDVEPDDSELELLNKLDLADTDEEQEPWLREFFARTGERMLRRAHMTGEPEAVREAFRAINRLIGGLRVIGDQYHIEKLSIYDIQVFHLFLLVDGRSLLHRFFGPGQPIWAHGATAGTPWVEALRRNLLTTVEPPVEKLLILDAKRYLLHGELRLAVLNTNAALESFVNRHFYERMASSQPSREVEGFLAGTSIFESCRTELIHLASAGDRAAGNAADLMPTPDVEEQFRKRPSVFRMVVKMHQHRPFGLSRTKLTALITRIRGKRNDVAHGQLDDSDLDRVKVQNSIDALEQFIELATETLAAERAVQGGE